MHGVYTCTYIYMPRAHVHTSMHTCYSPANHFISVKTLTLCTKRVRTHVRKHANMHTYRLYAYVCTHIVPMATKYMCAVIVTMATGDCTPWEPWYTCTCMCVCVSP